MIAPKHVRRKKWIPPQQAGRDETVFEVIVELYTGDITRREQAVKKLLQFKDVRIIPMLISTLGDDDERKATLAAITLQRFGHRAVPELIKALNYPLVDVRRKAVWVLWQIGDRRALRAFKDALHHDPDPKVRRYAACGLGLLGDPAAINALINALADTDDKVRWDSAVALAKLGSRSTRALTAAAQYAGPVVRGGAVNALAWIRDKDSIDILADALCDGDAYVRSRAAFALGWVGDRLAAEPLKQALADGDAGVRAQAAAALGWLHEDSAVADLAHLLNDDDEVVACAAVDALRGIATKEAHDALMYACQHPNPMVADFARASHMFMDYEYPPQADPVPVTGRNKGLWFMTTDQLKERRCCLVITHDDTIQ